MLLSGEIILLIICTGSIRYSWTRAIAVQLPAPWTSIHTCKLTEYIYFIQNVSSELREKYGIHHTEQKNDRNGGVAYIKRRFSLRSRRNYRTSRLRNCIGCYPPSFSFFWPTLCCPMCLVSPIKLYYHNVYFFHSHDTIQLPRRRRPTVEHAPQRRDSHREQNVE